MKLLLVFLVFGMATNRPSLKDWSTKLRKNEEITLAVKNRQINSQNLKKFEILFKENSELRLQFFKAAKGSEAFVRGEIEDEKVLQFLTQLLQLSILQIRILSEENKSQAILEETSIWFQFAADLAYEESTLVGLRLSHLIRSLLLDEIENLLKSKPQLLSDAEMSIKTWRAPWPIDRIILYESKRVLVPPKLGVVEKAALSLQKNPYQTLEAILDKLNGTAKDYDFLRKMWRQEDLEMMKNEVNRLQLVQAGASWARFQKNNKKIPQSWSDILQKPPTDYLTGRPMDWSRLVATMQKQ